MAYDRKACAASLDIAVKGYLTIAQASDVYTLTRTGKSESKTGLAHGEAAIATRLFAKPLFGRFAETLLALNAKAAGESHGVARGLGLSVRPPGGDTGLARREYRYECQGGNRPVYVYLIHSATVSANDRYLAHGGRPKLTLSGHSGW